MPDFDRIIKERVDPVAAARAEAEAIADSQARAHREATWQAAVATAPAALERLGQVNPATWPPTKTLELSRETKTLFGHKWTTYSIGGFVVLSFRYLGPEQTSVTSDHLRYVGTIYLLSDGRLAVERSATVIPLDERIEFLHDRRSSKFWADIPLERVLERLRELAQ